MPFHLNDIKTFREKNRQKAKSIPLSSVELIERIHKKKPEEIILGNLEPLILVRKLGGKYALVTGWRDYWRAKQNGDENIKAVIIYTKDRSSFISTFKRRIAIEDIKVADEFLQHPPKENKLRNIERYYRRHGSFDKPIVLGKGNVLRDGYARYLVAQKLGIKEIPYIR